MRLANGMNGFRSNRLRAGLDAVRRLDEPEVIAALVETMEALDRCEVVLRQLTCGRDPLPAERVDQILADLQRGS